MRELHILGNLSPHKEDFRKNRLQNYQTVIYNNSCNTELLYKTKAIKWFKQILENEK